MAPVIPVFDFFFFYFTFTYLLLPFSECADVLSPTPPVIKADQKMELFSQLLPLLQSVVSSLSHNREMGLPFL